MRHILSNDRLGPAYANPWLLTGVDVHPAHVSTVMRSDNTLVLKVSRRASVSS